MEQLSIDLNGNGTTDLKRIKGALENEIINPEYIQYLEVVENKDKSISIRAKSKLAAKIKLIGKSTYIEVKPDHEGVFVDHDLLHPSEKWLRIKITGIDDVLGLIKELSIVYMTELLSLGGELYGCCDMYIECSDALKCLHPDVLTSLACFYKKNLDAGRVFYGKNRNI